ncbi:hypothetical protein Nepgr_004314 [Nepenthes gracilis]|uniref:Uncharacterized protein n=1 Tax=Nepenthes gracilis TaxID=150966 RepID=A0AAD3XF27_NEPGR|nr:hypothetical protein Nepgr_004314 [Nepenthes gracilis]
MAGKLMQAIQYFDYGGGIAGLRHVESPVPDPKDDEVLMEVEAHRHVGGLIKVGQAVTQGLHRLGQSGPVATLRRSFPSL